MSNKQSKKRQKKSEPPKKTIDTLVEDIYSLFEKGADLSEEQLNDFSTSLARLVKDRFASYGKPRDNYLRFSNLGKNPRQLWLDINGTHIVPDPAPSDKLKFLYGDIIELLVMFLAGAAGHRVTDLQKQVELDGVKGSIDGTIDEELVDVKSTSGYSFNKFASEASLREQDSFGYVEQISGYAGALDKPHGYFLAVNKENGQLQLVQVRADDVRPLIKDLRDILSKPTPPFECTNDKPLGLSGNRTLGYPCTYCNHKEVCWPGLQSYRYSDGIKHLTHVAKEPQVEKVEKLLQ